MMDKFTREGHAAFGMKDWPMVLKINATAGTLGKEIYYSKAQVYHPGSGVLWEALSPASRAMYVGIAADLLKKLAPDCESRSPDGDGPVKGVADTSSALLSAAASNPTKEAGSEPADSHTTEAGGRLGRFLMRLVK